MRGGQGGAPAYRHNGGRSTQAGLQDTLEATRLRAAGVGSGLRSHPQRDDFIRRALDVVFRGRAWHFFVQSRPAWQIEDGSKVLQRLRVTASVAERFSWVSGALQEHLSQCARRNLRASVTNEFFVQSAMQPRAGYDLRSVGCSFVRVLGRRICLIGFGRNSKFLESRLGVVIEAVPVSDLSRAGSMCSCGVWFSVSSRFPTPP